MKDVLHNLTDDQVDLVKEECDQVHTELIKALEKDPDNTQLQIRACGWEQLCQNLGMEGYEWS